jgi:two-component system sensor kinase FixL
VSIISWRTNVAAKPVTETPARDLRILVLDPDPADVALIVREIELSGIGFRWTSVTSTVEFSEALDPTIDAILASYSILDFNPPDALKVLKCRNLDIPFIVLADGVDEGVVANSMKLGATDYILKDRMKRLGPAIMSAVAYRRLKVERARAESALLESRRRVEGIFEGAQDAIIATTLHGLVMRANPAAETMFGYSEPELVGRPISVLDPVNWKPRGLSILDRLGRGDPIENYDAVHLRKSGEEIHVSVSVSPIRDDGGKLAGAAWVARDINEQKLTQARLDVVQTELRHVSRLSAMGEMSSTLAHELNQPLSAISNYLGAAQRIMKKEPATFSQKVHDNLGKAAQQTLRAGEIIRRLREFVKPGDFSATAESLAELIKETRELALVGARQSGVRVRVELDRDADLVLVDKVQIQQVLLNLIRNAIEAMADSERRELIIASGATSDDMVEVRVSDTGCGLSEAIADRLFQSFVTTKPHGMGVGLSICRTIVEAQGGRIWASGNPGGGTVFHLTVPVAAVDEPSHAG